MVHHFPGCTSTHERKYDCFYCGEKTSQSPVLRRPVKSEDFRYGERVYPSCCLKCAQENLWRDYGVHEVPERIVDQARKLPACPMDHLDHRCSVRAVMIQSAYDRIATECGWKRQA